MLQSREWGHGGFRVAAGIAEEHWCKAGVVLSQG